MYAQARLWHGRLTDHEPDDRGDAQPSSNPPMCAVSTLVTRRPCKWRRLNRLQQATASKETESLGIFSTYTCATWRTPSPTWARRRRSNMVSCASPSGQCSCIDDTGRKQGRTIADHHELVQLLFHERSPPVTAKHVLRRDSFKQQPSHGPDSLKMFFSMWAVWHSHSLLSDLNLTTPHQESDLLCELLVVDLHNPNSQPRTFTIFHEPPI